MPSNGSPVRCGVEIRTGAEVTAITADADRVRGVVLADGTEVAADVVVANVDAEHLYTDLLPDPSASRRVRRAGRSTSGFAICAAVRGLTPGSLHHNVWFSEDERGEYEAIGRGEFPDDPTIYGCVSAVTDPSQAPDGCENWFLLVNTPPGVEVEPDHGTDLVLRRLAMHGVAAPRAGRVRPHDDARRHRRALRVAGRRDLRHVVERDARRVRTSREPWQPRRVCIWSADRATRAAACRSC